MSVEDDVVQFIGYMERGGRLVVAMHPASAAALYKMSSIEMPDGNEYAIQKVKAQVDFNECFVPGMDEADGTGRLRHIAIIHQM